MLPEINIQCENISKRFGQQGLFKGIALHVGRGEPLAITGANGSGKSTLIQIIAGIQRPTTGSVSFMSGGETIRPEAFSRYFSFTGPQVNPYDMLTAVENLMFTVKGDHATERIDHMLETFDLFRHRHKQVKYYSTGMKQRLKLVHALINETPALLFDEPGSNLDLSGKERMMLTLEELKAERTIIIASNEPDEINFCNERLNLGKQNN